MIDIRGEAFSDLDEIAEYGVLTFGEAASIAYERGLNALLLRLHAEPGIGRREEAFAEVRSFPYKSHRIYYRFESKTLVILRVLSPRQSPPDQL